MKHITVLDYEHMDNGLFLTAVARALAKQQNQQIGKVLVLHGESEYTERLIQTGIMREEATIRAIKDLNHRLIALFADEGVSAVGINGYQRKSVILENDELDIDLEYFQSLPDGPVLVLSNLVFDQETGKPARIPLPRYVDFLHNEFQSEQVFAFSKYDHLSPHEEVDTSANPLPDDLMELSDSIKVITTDEFKKLGEIEP